MRRRVIEKGKEAETNKNVDEKQEGGMLQQTSDVSERICGPNPNRVFSLHPTLLFLKPHRPLSFPGEIRKSYPEAGQSQVTASPRATQGAVCLLDRVSKGQQKPVCEWPGLSASSFFCCWNFVSCLPVSPASQDMLISDIQSVGTLSSIHIVERLNSVNLSLCITFFQETFKNICGKLFWA